MRDARLGGRGRMIGAVGYDAQGRPMLETLSAAGGDTTDVALLDGGATGIALIVVDRDGENQIVVCPGANSISSDETELCQLEVVCLWCLEAVRRAAGFLS